MRHPAGNKKIGSEQQRRSSAFFANLELSRQKPGQLVVGLRNPNNELFDHWYVLLDCTTGDRLGRQAMSRARAQALNELLKGTGFAWGMCS